MSNLRQAHKLWIVLHERRKEFNLGSELSPNLPGYNLEKLHCN
jgi:hypothetical protein